MTISRSRLLCTVLMLGALISCTTTTAVRVKPEDFETKGIRYWLAAPYLLVKEPVEVARVEELFSYNFGTQNLQLIDVVPQARPARYGDAASWEKLLPGVVFAKQQDDKLGTGADDGKKPKGDDDVEEGPKGGGADTSAASTQTGKVELAWLPDYCHQYAIHQTTVLAKQTQKLTLGDGWRFVSFEATQDSTDLVGKVLDVVGAVVGAGGGEADAAEGEGEGEGDEVAQAGGIILIKRVIITYVPPGLYPLVNRQNCLSVPTIDLNLLRHEQRVAWEVKEVGQ